MKRTPLIILLLSVVSYVIAAPAEQKITSLPGYNINNFNFAQYSGYISLESSQTNLFYWFVESSNDPRRDPLVLWLNGGPGCSSLDGLLSEHGPLHFNEDGSLYANPYSWNQAANVIYLESPAGVGFSYNGNGQYVLHDNVSASDALEFLYLWYADFPEYVTHPFYVAGESYAGHYVPQLAYLIAQNPGLINFQGIIVGNGVTDNWYDGNSYIPFIYNHAFVSEAQFETAVDECSFNFVNNSSPACQQAINTATNNVQNINPYNIYDSCITVSEKRPHPLNHIFEQLQGQIPCINSTTETNYLNRYDVQSAIHAKQGINWQVCNLVQNAEYVRDPTVLYIYPFLLNKGYRVLIYSGDVDSSVNYKGTQNWINSLNLQVEQEWRPWNVTGQVAGFIKNWEGLTFLTIRGAGHMVPQYKPENSLVFFSNWINKVPF